MACYLSLITYLVKDYDEAIAWFSKSLGFHVLEDTDQGQGKRWVVVAPNAERGARYLLAKAATQQQKSHIGMAAGGRVAYFLYTDDFVGTAKSMAEAGVLFDEKPRHEKYGTVAVFRDLYGNRWDLLEPKI